MLWGIIDFVLSGCVVRRYCFVLYGSVVPCIILFFLFINTVVLCQVIVFLEGDYF